MGLEMILLQNGVWSGFWSRVGDALMHYFEIMMVNFFFNLIWEYSDFKIPNINLEKGSAIQLINLFLWIYNWGKNLIVKKEKKKVKI